MKNILLFLGLLCSLVLVGCGSSGASVGTDTDNVLLTADQQTDTYKIYTTETFDAAVADGKRVVLNFRASRCPTCTSVSNDILANQAALPTDVVVLEVDYDKYPAVKERYNVVQQTTFAFIDANGEYVETIETIRSFADLMGNL